MPRVTTTTHRLPPATSLLAVCAHPDDESFGLGAILAAYGAAGCRLSVLCLTHGEGSTLHAAGADLFQTRAEEFRCAAGILGVGHAELLTYADGHLAEVPLPELAGEVDRLAAAVEADRLLVFDEAGVTGHADHRQATAAARLAAAPRALPVLAWALPTAIAEQLNSEHHTAFCGQPAGALDIELVVDRSQQRRAIACHRSQATDNVVLERRLALQRQREWLRHLVPGPAPAGTAGA